MKKLILTFAALILIAAPALADTVTIADSWGGTNGGEFIVTPSGFGFTPASLGEQTTPQFETFCVETAEFLNFGSTFTVSSITGKAIMGRTPPGDPISNETAWLYDQFISRTLAYQYDTSTQANRNQRISDANDLQNAIWAYEGEGGGPTKYTVLANAAVNPPGGGGWVNPGTIKVMNLTWSDGTRAQDLLVKVPAPAAVLLGVVGLALVGWARKRIR